MQDYPPLTTQINMARQLVTEARNAQGEDQAAQLTRAIMDSIITADKREIPISPYAWIEGLLALPEMTFGDLAVAVNDLPFNYVPYGNIIFALMDEITIRTDHPDKANYHRARGMIGRQSEDVTVYEHLLAAVTEWISMGGPQISSRDWYAAAKSIGIRRRTILSNLRTQTPHGNSLYARTMQQIKLLAEQDE